MMTPISISFMQHFDYTCKFTIYIYIFMFSMEELLNTLFLKLMIINNKDLKFLCDYKCGGNEIYDGSVNGNVYIV